MGLRYRFLPTPGQQELLVRTFGCVRWVWNRVLEERIRRWREERRGMSYKEMSAYLTELKAMSEHAWLNEVSSVPLQQTLRHLDKAYRRFFDWCRTRKGRRVGFPRFARKTDRQSAEFTASAFGWDGRTLTMAKSKEPLDLVWTQVFWGDPSTMTISLEPDGTWWVSLRVEMEVATAKGGRDAIGLDLGLTHYATDDLGNKVDAPKPLRKARKRLVREQRRMARKRKGGRNREKQRRRVARVHARVRNVRRDFQHRLSSKVVAENQVICLETLNVSGMMRNRRLSRAIADCGWSEFVRQVEYKARWRGRTVVRLDRWEASSKTCSCCGHRLEELDLGVRVWTCPSCASVHDRDVNAAINIRAAGLAVLAQEQNACGAGVRREVRKDPPPSAKSGAEWLRRKQEGPTGIRSERRLAA